MPRAKIGLRRKIAASEDFSGLNLSQKRYSQRKITLRYWDKI